MAKNQYVGRFTPDHFGHFKPCHSYERHQSIKANSLDIKVSAISRYDDEMQDLHEAGVQVVFNLYEEAGFGFANHTYNQIFGKL